MRKSSFYLEARFDDKYHIRECSCSVVEGLTRDLGATGSSLTGLTALCP